MLRMLRFWNALLHQGRRGEYMLLGILLAFTPTILVWMLVIDGLCWLRDRLDGGRRPLSRLAHDASVAAVALLCIPVLLGNALLLGRIALALLPR